MGKGPKCIFMVKVTGEVGEQWFYAGTESEVEALRMAAERGHESDDVTVQGIPNKFGIQFGEWRQAAP